MKTHLKYAIGTLALLACLSLGSTVQANESAQQASAQDKVAAKQLLIGPLAWQRVGSPISLEG